MTFTYLSPIPIPPLPFQLPVLFTFLPGCLRDILNVNMSKSNFLIYFPDLHFLHYSSSQQWLHPLIQSKNLKSPLIPDFLSYLIFDSLASMPRTPNLPPHTTKQAFLGHLQSLLKPSSYFYLCSSWSEFIQQPSDSSVLCFYTTCDGFSISYIKYKLLAVYCKAPATSLFPSLPTLPFSRGAPATLASCFRLTCHPPSWNLVLSFFSTSSHFVVWDSCSCTLFSSPSNASPSELASLAHLSKISVTLYPLNSLYFTSKHTSPLKISIRVFVYCLCLLVDCRLHSNMVLVLCNYFLNNWRNKWIMIWSSYIKS